jgi:cyclopropane fatty-acyl-phospholipid synthase-like methyltransferase
MAELQFRAAAAAGYDRSVGEMTRRIVPSLLGAARLAPGMRVLDIATGTGLAAEAALPSSVRRATSSRPTSRAR